MKVRIVEVENITGEIKYEVDQEFTTAPFFGLFGSYTEWITVRGSMTKKEAEQFVEFGCKSQQRRIAKEAVISSLPRMGTCPKMPERPQNK